MRLDDYLLDQSGFDWNALLEGWHWLLPPLFTIWVVNRYGDLFLRPEDGSVHMLDIGGGSLTRLAADREDFCRQIDEEDNANVWLMIPLVARLVEAGVRLQPGQCYSFVIPPILGGEYSLENTAVLPVTEHFGVYGFYHSKLRNLPDGTEVIIVPSSDQPDLESERIEHPGGP